MKTNIAANIRQMRRERRLTQEQLAEVLGVTVGAVSKWETGLSIPDIGLIMELAAFFDTSVDVLLGYEMHASSLKASLERLEQLTNGKQYDEMVNEAESILKKYPNSFDAVYNCSAAFGLAGMELNDHERMRRSLELSERAVELLPQCREPGVSEQSIRRSESDIYIALGEYDAALALLKETNIRGVNNTQLGYLLGAICHRPEEAIPYLSSGLTDVLVNQMLALTGGLYAANCDLGRPQEAAAALELCLSVLRALREGDGVTYIDRLEAIFLSYLSTAYVRCGEEDKAIDALRRARRLFLRFATEPCYTMHGFRFLSPDGADAVLFDMFGEDAPDAPLRWASEDKETRDTINRLWEEINNEE